MTASTRNRRSRLLAGLAGGGLVLGLGCLGGAAVTIGGLWAFSESAVWQGQTAVEVDESLHDLHRRCLLLPESGARTQLEVQLALALEDPRRRNIGLWEVSHLEAVFDRSVQDGYLSESEMLDILTILQAAMRDW